MGTLVGVLMVISGATLLAIVRPWRSDPPDDDDEPAARASVAERRGHAPAKRPCPGPPPAAKRRHLEAITRARRVPPEPGREEILLPHWLGPVSPDRLERKRALAD